MNRQRFSLGLLLIVLAIMAAACGPKTAAIEATFTDFAFTPNTWEVPAGAEVTLSLKNDGSQEHEYVIMIMGKDATIPFDAEDEGNIYWEHELQPGESGTVVFTAPSEAGTYNIVCGTAGHLESGMRGVLTVK